MTKKNPWNTLDNMLDQLGGNVAGTIPKICHHYPDRYRLLTAKGSEEDMEAFHARSYDDRILTGVYIVVFQVKPFPIFHIISAVVRQIVSRYSSFFMLFRLANTFPFPGRLFSPPLGWRPPGNNGSSG